MVPNDSHSASDDANDDRDSKKNDVVETTMDFAANIEKVKEVIDIFCRLSLNQAHLLIFGFVYFLTVRLVLGPNIQ